MFVRKIKIKYNFFSFLIVFFISFLDLSSKHFIKKIFIVKNIENLSINSFLNFISVENYGMTFGFFSKNNIGKYLSFFVLFGIFFLIRMIFIEENKYKKYALSFVLGGAIGNFIDRMVHGSVFDFIDLHYQTYHWYIFNVADSFICIGVFILLILDFKKK